MEYFVSLKFTIVGKSSIQTISKKFKLILNV